MISRLEVHMKPANFLYKCFVLFLLFASFNTSCLTFLKNFVASREKKESNKNELRTVASSIEPDFIKVV